MRSLERSSDLRHYLRACSQCWPREEHSLAILWLNLSCSVINHCQCCERYFSAFGIVGNDLGVDNYVLQRTILWYWKWHLWVEFLWDSKRAMRSSSHQDDLGRSVIGRSELFSSCTAFMSHFCWSLSIVIRKELLTKELLTTWLDWKHCTYCVKLTTCPSHRRLCGYIHFHFLMSAFSTKQLRALFSTRVGCPSFNDLRSSVTSSCL